MHAQQPGAIAPVFRDDHLDGEFSRQGVVTVPFLSPEARADLLERLEPLGLAGSAGFADTASAALRPDQRQSVHDLLRATFEASASSLLADYEPVMSSLLTKWPGAGGEKEIHRDLRLVDEARFRAVCIWVPLVDVDADNGALAVLRGSHQVDTGPRSVPTTPQPDTDPVRQLAFDDLEVVPVAAGEAVVFDLALVHGSDHNRTSRARPAVGMAFVPRAAEVSLDFCHPDDRIEALAVPDPDLFRRIDWRIRPPELRSLGMADHEVAPVSTADLIRRSAQRAQTLTRGPGHG